MKIKILGSLSLLVLLSACGHDPLGIKSKKAPDEFAVMPVKPLTLPTNYTLTPPSELKKSIQKTPQQIAKSSLNGGQSLSEQDMLDSDNPFVQRLVQQKTDLNIRDTIDNEATEGEDSKYLIDSLVFWGEKKAPGVVVDPQKERERLEKNKKAGLPITNGDTPMID